MDKITAVLHEARIHSDENRSKDMRHFAASVVEAIEELRQQLDDRASPGMVLSLKATIRDLQEQLTDAEESNKAVERALKDVDYRGTYADGVLYLKRQLASMTNERDEIAAQARMLDRMVDERDGRLAAALAACEARDKVLVDVATYGQRPSSIWKFFYPSCTGDYVNLVEVKEKLQTIIAIKPDASALKAHDEALIEWCAVVCEDLFERRGIDCAAAIRELKGTM